MVLRGQLTLEGGGVLRLYKNEGTLRLIYEKGAAEFCQLTVRELRDLVELMDVCAGELWEERDA